jgi:CubicO group peptidase (beta-lactamase class C family)
LTSPRAGRKPERKTGRKAMSKPLQLGMSAKRLETLDKAMTRRYVEAGLVTGYQTLIYRRGQMVHSSVVGSMDVERGKPMRDDALFRIYSMTKPLTAVALMMLVEEGAIGLDDDVAAHIPSWKDMGLYAGLIAAPEKGPPKFATAPAKRPMKVIDLATHTAGLTYGFNMRTPVDAAYRKMQIGAHDTPGGLTQFVDDLSRLALDFSPGDHWNYSVAIDVMGYLVEKVSGMAFGEFLRTRLFEPLGMNDTAFYCPPEKTDRFTSCYAPGPDGKLRLQDDAGKSLFAAPPKLESGGGGLVSSAHDYMRFCRMMLGHGTLDGVQILSPKSVQLFSLNHLPGAKTIADLAISGTAYSEGSYHGNGFSLACGVNVDVAKTRLPGTLGEFYWGGAAATAFWIDPGEDLAVVYMTQVMASPHRLAMRRDMRTLVYSAMTESNLD